MASPPQSVAVKPVTLSAVTARRQTLRRGQTALLPHRACLALLVILASVVFLAAFRAVGRFLLRPVVFPAGPELACL